MAKDKIVEDLKIETSEVPRDIKIEDLPVLVELLRELGYYVEDGESPLTGPSLLVKVGEKTVQVGVGYCMFIATDLIPGIPMHFFGHGNMKYAIEI